MVMSLTNTAPTPQARGAARSPVACLPCRSRHLKCDATRPQCSRCLEGARQCQYAPSRRGGLDRAALAERRRRSAAVDSVVPGTSQTTPALPQATAVVGQDSLLHDGHVSKETPPPASPPNPQTHVDQIETDPLITSYYRNFHRLHPFLLPRRSLIQLHQGLDPAQRSDLEALIAAMRLVGHIYAARELSVQLRDHVKACMQRTWPANPVLVQCRLLFSIALFWCGFKAEAAREMGLAVKLALDLGMSRREFADRHGAADAVLAESWRRTWWMLYIVDAYYAGTLGTMKFAVLDVDETVDLPCEEAEYELGIIPPPKTLIDFDCREFAAQDARFSSFAYLISAVRCAALAISTSPEIATTEDSARVIQSADSTMDGWSLLLPKHRKQVMSKTGEIDELMFQAHLLIHVATIGLHRPLSDLKFNPAEAVSSCAREPPANTPRADLVHVHTARVQRSVEAQIRFLALPARPFHHSPFVTCMISEGTLALLSACAFRLRETDLAVARGQIRMVIGCLQDLGGFWPRTAANVREIQTIARHVLGIGGSPGATLGRGSMPHASGGNSRSGGESCAFRSTEVEVSSTDADILASLGSMEDVCGWYGMGDLGPEVAHWQWMGNDL